MYLYTCPNCGQGFELLKRVTLRGRSCPECGHAITLGEYRPPARRTRTALAGRDQDRRRNSLLRNRIIFAAVAALMLLGCVITVAQGDWDKALQGAFGAVLIMTPIGLWLWLKKP